MVEPMRLAGIADKRIAIPNSFREPGHDYK